jgi:DNA-binding transcriptional MerR regulator
VKRIIAAGTVAGAIGSIWAAMLIWKDAGFPVPVMAAQLEERVSPIEHRVAMVEQQTLETQAAVINNEITELRQRIYNNQAAQESYRSKGEQPPEWMINEWIELENDLNNKTDEYQRLLDAIQPAE